MLWTHTLCLCVCVCVQNRQDCMLLLCMGSLPTRTCSQGTCQVGQMPLWRLCTGSSYSWPAEVHWQYGSNSNPTPLPLPNFPGPCWRTLRKTGSFRPRGSCNWTTLASKKYHGWPFFLLFIFFSCWFKIPKTMLVVCYNVLPLGICIQ